MDTYYIESELQAQAPGWWDGLSHQDRVAVVQDIRTSMPADDRRHVAEVVANYIETQLG